MECLPLVCHVVCAVVAIILIAVINIMTDLVLNQLMTILLRNQRTKAQKNLNGSIVHYVSELPYVGCLNDDGIFEDCF